MVIIPIKIFNNIMLLGYVIMPKARLHAVITVKVKVTSNKRKESRSLLKNDSQTLRNYGVGVMAESERQPWT